MPPPFFFHAVPTFWELTCSTPYLELVARSFFSDQVRAKTKPASMRMPLEEDLEAVVEGAGEEGEEPQPDLAAAADFEPVDAEKVRFCVTSVSAPPAPPADIAGVTRKASVDFDPAACCNLVCGDVMLILQLFYADTCTHIYRSPIIRMSSYVVFFFFSWETMPRVRHPPMTTAQV